jgi:hypothetical protein
MRFILAALLTVHAVAHLVGFVVPWRLITSAEVPYRTTILAGSIDIGATGARLLGLGWLLVALACAALAGGVILRASWWHAAALPVVVVSLVMCVLGWPDSRFGIVANVLILALLLGGARVGWLRVP